MKKRPPDGALALPRPAEFDVVGLLRRACPVLVVVSAWLAFHPYTGIVHDARLYVAMALDSLDPATFANDLFFRFGSQNDFTLFTWLFAPLVERLGPQPAAFLAVIVGQVLWLSGASWLATRLTGDTAAAAVSLVLVAIVPPNYGGHQTFVFGEGYATPRLFAEALSLWAVGALAARRHILSLALVVVAALLHPLVGVTALCLGWCFLFLRNWRWVCLAPVGLAVVAAACVAGIAPFDRLTQTMDPEWLAVVTVRNVYLFPDLWEARDWGRFVLACGLVAACAATCGGWQRRLMIATAITGIAGVAVMHVGADLMHNLFVIQLQPFRTVWLLYALAYLSAGPLVVATWRLKPDGIGLLGMLTVGWFTVLWIEPALGAVVALAVLTVVALRLRGHMAPLPFVLQVGAAAIAALVIGTLAVFRGVRIVDVAAFWSEQQTLLPGIGGVTAIDVVVLAVIAALAYRVRAGFVRQMLPIAAFALLIVAAMGWDRRDAWTRALTGQAPVAVFDALLPDNAQVYWEGDARGAWLLLGRPSYVSALQGAGIIFERRTALAFRDRARIVAPITTGDLIDVFRPQDEPLPAIPHVDRPMIANVCRRAADDLDAIVLTQKVDGAYAAHWRLPAPIPDLNALLKGEHRPPLDDFYLYRCADLS